MPKSDGKDKQKMTTATAAAAKRPAVLEEHFTVKELAEAWKLSADTVLRMVRDEPGVLRINERISGRLLQKGHRPPRVSIRVPASVAKRIHDARCA